MDSCFVCPACHATHCEPADAAFVLAVLCLDCELAARYHEDSRVTPIYRAAA